MIPIYRAKKLDSDEYVEGYLIGNLRGVYFYIKGNSNGYEFEEPILQKTLSIHFPNMLDKNGEKIFASLAEDGKGGSKCTDAYNESYTCIFNKITNSCVMSYETIQLQTDTMGVYDGYWKTYEVTGIKE